MTGSLHMTRRGLLAAGVAVSFLGASAYAAAPDNRRLVVIVARGGLDGMSLAPPVGDPDYAGLRGALAMDWQDVLPIDETFGLHPKLMNLHRLMGAGQARIVPAAAVPDRIRSHFDAQDLLETGGAHLHAAVGGWLNRALAAGGGQRLQGISVGARTPLILQGQVQCQSWSPGAGLPGNSDAIVSALQDLYASDPLLGPAFDSGLATEAVFDSLTEGEPIQPGDARKFAVTTGRYLARPDGPQTAVFSLSGFDTHSRQEGQLAQQLANLDAVIAGLEDGLGDHWRDTAVVLATEFGRTARANGTGGTDHGTASCMILAGGALARGGVVGDWPGLAEAKLFENRDLAPTLDVRSVFKGLLIDHLGLDARAVETSVFPDSAAAPPVRGLIA